MADLPGYISDTELYYEADGLVGCLVAGVKTTVAATRAIAFGLDDNTNVHDTAGMFKVFGDVEITGELTVGSTTIGGGGTIILDDLADVAITSPAAAQVLAYSGSAWVNTAPIVRRATVTLTDAQVKALPTTPFSLVAAPGSGLLLVPHQIILMVNTNAAIYTNINAASSIWAGLGSAAMLSSLIANDAGVSVADVTAFIGTAGKWATMLRWPFEDNRGDANGWGPMAYIYDYSAANTNTALTLQMDNAGSGNLTGGNAANGLRAIVLYSIETVL